MLIKYLSVGKPQLIKNKDGQAFKSGIRKRNVQAIFLGESGFDNDGVHDIKNHGGKDRAVCFYPFEHYKKWESFLGRKLHAPAFGENLTITNMLEEEVCIGDIYKIGNVIVQVTQGRIPCATIDHSNDRQGMLAEVIRTGRTGYFAKVLEEGIVEPGLKLELLERPNPGINIYDLHHLFFHDRKNLKEISKVILIPELAERMRNNFQSILSKEKVNE